MSSFVPPCANALEPLPLVDEVAHLHYLQRLSLSGRLRGNIPPAWTALQNLQQL